MQHQGQGQQVGGAPGGQVVPDEGFIQRFQRFLGWKLLFFKQNFQVLLDKLTL